MYPTWKKVVYEAPQHIDEATGVVTKATKEVRFYPPDGVLKKAKSTDMTKVVDSLSDTKRVNMVESISNYVYGHPDWISVSTWDENIDKIVDMMEKGKSKDAIRSFIEKNSDFYSGRAATVYPWIAKQMGFGQDFRYKNWKEFYTDRVDEIMKNLNKNGKLSIDEKRRLAELQKLNLQRNYYLTRFTKAESMDDILKYMQEIENKELDAIYDSIKGTKHMDSTSKQSPIFDEVRRGRFFDEDVSIANRKTGEFTFKNEVLRNDIYDNVVERIFLQSNIYDSVKNGKLSKAHVQWANSVTDEAVDVMKKVFNKNDFHSLSEKQKDALYNMAVYNAGKKADGKKVLKDMTKDTSKYVLDEMKQRAVRTQAEFITSHAREGAKVNFSNVLDDEIFEGVIQKINKTDKGVTTFDILKSDGSVITDVAPAQISKVVNNVASMPVEEIAKLSPITNDFVLRQQELTKLIEENKSALKMLDDEFKTKYDDILKDFANRENDALKRIKDIEIEKAKIDEALKNGEFDKVDKLNNNIKRIEDAFASDDALESFMKGWIGESKVQEIISKNNPDVGKIYLDVRTDISDKIRELAKKLRDDFIQIGTEEVKIGKLKQEQLDALMYDYVAHILTPDGQKLFAKDDIVKHIPNFGDDLGYGRKFNPHSLSRTITEIPDANGHWIKNPTIEQINEYFRQFTDGKNVFSEDIADIYLARALKHNELMYDNEYMNNMMNVFGKSIGANGVVDDGYKAVVNYGSLKQYVQNTASQMANLQIEQMKSMGHSVATGTFAEIMEQKIHYLLDSMGLDYAILDELSTPMIELSEEQISKVLKIRPDIVKQVNEAIVQKANQARKIQIAKDQSRFLQLYDKFTHLIKLNQTTVLPSFHARNKISNTFNNWLGVGSDAVNVEFQKQAFKAMKNDGNVDGILKIVKEDGTKSQIAWSELYENAKKYGVVDDGFFAKELGAEAMSTGILPKVPAKFDPTDTKNFVLYKKGAEIGSLIEGQDRLIHFASQVSRGMSFEDAAESVNKFLLDYSDLTAFEASVMKRIIPYYTWLRKNSALQLEMMLEQPKKFMYVSKVMGGIEGMVNEEDRINREFVNDFAKDWVQTPFQVTNPEGRLEPVLWNPNLPFMDISRIPDPFNLKSSLPEMFTQMNPLIKVPIEQAINRNVFFDSPIVKNNDNQVTKRLDHIGAQFGLYNVASDFAKKSGTDLGLHALNSTSGIKLLSYDYDKYKAMKIQELLAKKRYDIRNK